MNKNIWLATAAFMAVGVIASEASAVDVELSGHLNKAFLVYDDGRDTESVITDNNLLSSRWRLKGTQQLDNNLTAGVLFEVEMRSNPSNTFTQQTANALQSSTPVSNSPTFGEREARVSLGGDWGTFMIGQMTTATWKAGEQSLVGVNDLLVSDLKDIGGGLAFRTNTGVINALDSDGSALTLAEVANNMDSRGLADAVRYDSPIFNGAQLRASIMQGGDVDAALFYKGKFGDLAVKGAIGYLVNNDSASGTNTVQDQAVVSFSVKHDSGLAAALAYGQQDLDNKSAGNDDPTFFYAKVGYSWDQFEIAADYAVAENNDTSTVTNHELQSTSIGAQYNMGHGVSLAAMYRLLDLEVTGANTDEIGIGALNLKVKF